MTHVMVPTSTRCHEIASVRDSEITGGSTSGGSATRCLEVDHRKLDVILDEVERAAAAGRFPQAHEQFVRFAVGLLRHIDAEENVLFPQLTEADEGATGPISVMRLEH